MIGTIWESVLRVPILLLLSDAVFFGPGRGFSDPQKRPKNFFDKNFMFFGHFFIIFQFFYNLYFFILFMSFFRQKWGQKRGPRGGSRGGRFWAIFGGPRQLSRGPIFDYFLLNSILIAVVFLLIIFKYYLLIIQSFIFCMKSLFLLTLFESPLLLKFY